MSWPKRITVDKRVVTILSVATYENFPNALKEIITNSFDADASTVTISIDLKKETITIEDNGKGLSEEDFEFYLRIAGTKRTKELKTSSGRSIIGQFGIGFLSSFPFFKNYHIESKKSGTPEIIFANVPCYKYFNERNIVDVSNIEIAGGVRYTNSLFSNSFTKIILSGFTNLAKAYFDPNKNPKARKNSIQIKSPFEKLKWQLSEDLPIKYRENVYNYIFKIFSPNLKFDVTVNNDLLYREIYGKEILESDNNSAKQIGKIKFLYFIVTNKAAVTPFEARYLKLRNLNVGVGSRETFGLGTEVGGARSRLQWLSGEIIILEGMNDLIKVSRDNFNYSTDYEALKEFFIQKLTYFSNRLEEEAKVEKHFSSKEDESIIQDIRLLDPDFVKRKIEKLKKVGIQINRSNFEKRIFINNKKYSVRLGEWDYNKELEPACKIKRNEVIINKKYPLFSKSKHTDVFIKLHLMLLSNFEKHTLTEKSYSKLINDIFKFYKHYL